MAENGLVFKRSLPGRSADDLAQVLDYVKSLRGVDFNACQPDSIGRRLALRLAALNLPDYQAYCHYLAENDQEIDALIDSLTLKVSRFFRNPFVFEALAALLLPRLISAAGSEPIRVWCAGCAKGEEPYSLAILFKELLAHHPAAPPLFILATDIDAQALRTAQAAVYSEEAVAEVKKGQLDHYFTLEHGRYRLHEEITKMVTFARHDVTSAIPPTDGVFSGYHLILCRNVQIYFVRTIQRRTMTTLAGCLRKGGALVLGEAETLPEALPGPGLIEMLPYSKVFIKEN
jgi:chemotaxis methyl-accepting protein methylase